MRIACVVILYRPPENVTDNLLSYHSYPEKIYLIDNTETLSLPPSFAVVPGTVCIHDGENRGIAARLNQACRMAIAEGYDLLLTMDQDSYFDAAAMEQYFGCVKNFSNFKKTAMFGLVHDGQAYPVEGCVYREAQTLITSGSVINLAIFKQLPGFDENLFIDLVDTDYCFAARQAGFRLVEFPHISMHHRIGDVVSRRSFKNFAASKRSLHSSLRLYYMVRNFFYLKKKYGKLYSAELSTYRTDLLHRIKNNLLYGQSRISACRMVIRGVADFYRGRTGKYGS